MGIVTALRDLRTVRTLLTGAEAEARRGGEPTPGPEHLLLAATALPDGTAAAALTRAGVDPERLRGAVEAVHAAALASVGVGAEVGEPGLRGPATGPIRSTPQAQQVFRAAVAAAKAARSPLRGAHVVAAVCDLERGTAVRALETLGVDRDRLRAAAHDVG